MAQCRRTHLYWIAIAGIMATCFYVGWKRLYSSDAVNEPTTVNEPIEEIHIDYPVTSKIQFTKEFRDTFEKRIEVLVKRNASAEDPDLIKLVRDMMVAPFPKKTYSGSGTAYVNELVTSVNQLLKNKTNGFYIECGALDGEKASNTIFFERYRDWDGLLIEMDPEYFKEVLTKNRHAWSINACVSPYDHIIRLPFKGKGPETPELLMDQASLKKDSSHFVTCFPLETFILALKRQKVDFFCFDIEGLEMKILKTFRFDRIDMTVLSVECLKNICNEQESKDFMKGKGYETHKFIDINGHGVFMRDFIFYKRPK